MNYTWRQTAVSRWSDKNKNIWSEFLSWKENFEQLGSNYTKLITVWSIISSILSNFGKIRSSRRRKQKQEKIVERDDTGRITGSYCRGCGLSLYFFFFFFFPCLTQKVASPFEAVECGPRWRCCRIDLVPTFALRGRRGTVFAGARVMSTSS